MGDAELQMAAVKQAIWTADSRQALYHTSTLARLVFNSLVSRRMNLSLLLSFAVIAMVLSAIGIYGVVAFVTAQRTSEVGIRIVLGATPWTLRRLLLRDAMRPIGLGLALGLLASLALARLLTGFLDGVAPSDPSTFASVAIIVATVAVGACYVPARRASEVDPLALQS